MSQSDWPICRSPSAIRAQPEHCSRQRVTQRITCWRNMFTWRPYFVKISVVSGIAWSVVKILTTVMTNMVVDKDKNHVKPRETTVDLLNRTEVGILKN